MQTFTVSGATCADCKDKIERSVRAIGGVKHVHFDLTSGELHVEADHPLQTRALSSIVSREGNYSVSEGAERGSKSVLVKYRALIGVLILIVAYTLSAYFFRLEPTIETTLRDFMFAFFFLFGLLEVITLTSFKETFRRYDPIASFIPIYGYIYPFLLLLFAALIFYGIGTIPVALMVIALLSVQTIGISTALRRGEEIQCACIGTAFALPLSWVTVAENVVMIVMAVSMIALPAAA